VNAVGGQSSNMLVIAIRGFNLVTLLEQIERRLIPLKSNA
jgi:hypothetical protein